MKGFETQRRHSRCEARGDAILVNHLCDTRKGPGDLNHFVNRKTYGIRSIEGNLVRLESLRLSIHFANQDLQNLLNSCQNHG